MLKIYGILFVIIFLISVVEIEESFGRGLNYSPPAHLRVIDIDGNSLSHVRVDQQAYLSYDIVNGYRSCDKYIITGNKAICDCQKIVMDDRVTCDDDALNTKISSLNVIKTKGVQPFAYLVQIQNDNGITVSLAWISGSLTLGQSFSPTLSWMPTEKGIYTATAFVWESLDNPTPLSPPISTTIKVISALS